MLTVENQDQPISNEGSTNQEPNENTQNESIQSESLIEKERMLYTKGTKPELINLLLAKDKLIASQAQLISKCEDTINKLTHLEEVLKKQDYIELGKILLPDFAQQAHTNIDAFSSAISFPWMMWHINNMLNKVEDRKGEWLVLNYVKNILGYIELQNRERPEEIKDNWEHKIDLSPIRIFVENALEYDAKDPQALITKVLDYLVELLYHVDGISGQHFWEVYWRLRQLQDALKEIGANEKAFELLKEGKA